MRKSPEISVFVFSAAPSPESWAHEGPGARAGAEEPRLGSAPTWDACGRGINQGRGGWWRV